ncbi:hypothetical protein BUALT_Bualt10G0067200 [Buddleja alternifolia]|uniref:GRF-type domain-containing protein n=1 Tax=Buddleja alternifolia TaxID=168488 RepID=A0AAV6WWM0_9LAMI|nr:hypothetical protein BUALT_Bualt10G0067200 [Buddleja alternifolia]
MTTKNQGRKFYTCPAKDHKFFKWAEDVKDDELIDVPECGGCSAGICRVRREKNGRILFMCRVKEGCLKLTFLQGEGSCGYRVWKDELEKSATHRREYSITSIQPTLTNCKDPNTAYTNLVEKSKQNDERADNESPVVDTSHSLQGLGATSWKIERSKCLEDKSGELSRRPSKRSRYGDLKAPRSLISADSLALRLDINSVSLKNNVGWKLLLAPRSLISAHSLALHLDINYVSIKKQCWMEVAIRQNLSPQLQGWWGRLAFHPLRCLTVPAPKSFTCYVSSPLDSTFVVQDEIPVNSGALTTLTRTLLGVENCRKSLFNSVRYADLSATKPLHVAPDVPLFPSFETPSPKIMTKSISMVFGEAAEHLQNDLLIHLETRDVWDHETMSQAAEATFAALNRLCFDHQHLKDRAKEVIHCAKSLAEIEQSMPRNDCSYRKLVDHWSSERKKLEKINTAHAKAVDTVTNNKKRVKFLHEDISSIKDLLFHMESELSCCEIELKNTEHELEKISKNKEVLEGEYLIVSKELEESKKLHEEREAERDATRAAFDRARALLRG